MEAQTQLFRAKSHQHFAKIPPQPPFQSLQNTHTKNVSVSSIDWIEVASLPMELQGMSEGFWAKKTAENLQPMAPCFLEAGDLLQVVNA